MAIGPQLGQLWLLFLILSISLISIQGSKLGRRELPSLLPTDITKLVTATDPLSNLDPSNPTSHLSKILIPRAGMPLLSLATLFDQNPTADTQNNTLVRNYIVSTLKALNWHIELDEFSDTTPIGPKRFTNIIATKDPNASRRVVLSAHFDSKYFPQSPQNQVGIVASIKPQC